jgi:cobalt-zinc-cadmium efflux system protein
LVHSHSHTDGHSHRHEAPRDLDASQIRRLRWALILTAGFLIAEVVGAWVSNSLALLADAGHMLTDAGALALSLFVAWFSRQPASPRHTYGYLRWEIMAAFINGATLLLVSAWILWEAARRFATPEPLEGGIMMVVAAIGLLVNAGAAWMLHPNEDTSLNVRGAYLHILGDLLASVGTLAAALIVWQTGWLAADPIASVVTTVLVMRSAWRLVRESVDVLLEHAPGHIDEAAVRRQIEAIPGVESVHDLHIWTVTSGVIALSAHAIVRDPAEQQHVLEHAHSALRLFGIEHVTIQLERTNMHEHHLHR